jgi:transcription-repair coupling factor (superfamily II helicase)
MQKWRKKLQKYLDGAENAAADFAGVELSALFPLLLRLAMHVPVPVVAALPDAVAVDKLREALDEALRLLDSPLRVLYIPEAGRGKLLFPGGESRRARALNLALAGEFDLLVGSVHALLGPAPPPEETRGAVLTLKPGMKLSPLELAERLVRLDYDDEYEVTAVGEFSRRGGIVDFFSPAHDFPCRVEFFGDEVESLRGFLPETQRSTGSIDEYRCIGRAGITAGGAAESDVFEYLGDRDFQLALFHPESAFELLGKYSVPGAEKRLETLVDERRDKSRLTVWYELAGAEHSRPADVLPSVVDYTGGVAASGASELAAAAVGSRLRELLRSGGGAVWFAAHAEDAGMLRTWAEKAHLAPDGVEFATGSFPCGFQLLTEGLWALTEAEAVALGFRRTAQTEEAVPVPVVEEVTPAAVEAEEFSLADLDEGDYAVHVEHGIGIFRGLRTLRGNGSAREVMVLEFRDGQLLYVPLLQAYKVSRYLGAPGKVTLHALGSSRWNNEKERARSGVRSFAADMLRLQAMRNSIPGIAFAADVAENRAFVRSFPYPDTPDQRRATLAVSRDMTSSRPMDRLICGDVGYGKTEIAMRAVFRAVNAGFQAAVLAPTTVLAQQHFRSFSERFAEYPFNIALLSRLRTPAEQAEAMRNAASGRADIIIGTHRLCSDQLRFKNLGLVVIDEEQRFGVEHKERLRRFRAEADVLTLSATPIPRTLYLAMAGARDLSTLMTPPKMRMPVKTVIAPEEEQLVVTALKAELARGGQVYYLHNRVRSIEEKARRLRELLPDARIGVAHGQMPEHALEEVMDRFLHGGVDILVCSTIIESGLDVPNANTIIIERADRFGLAELYQLRGRVGRWSRQAYAYMLLPRYELVGTDARKRLAAIRRCSNLGAGFQLALHDLEIRGSGNLLGAEQSGHLNAIGFDLYCQLLRCEIAKLRGEKEKLIVEVDVNIDFVTFALDAAPGVLAAAIPPEYIGGERLRVDAYRKLAGLEDERELEDFRDELIDRFGSLPPQVRNLIEVVRLKLLAADAGYRILSVVNGRVVLRNPTGSIYRLPDGTAPQLDYRDPPELRIMHLARYLRGAKS